MKTLGFILSILCLLIAPVILWLGYILTFEGSHVSGGFESEPREGWVYWQNKEYWEDIRAFTIYLILSLGGGLLPLASLWRARFEIHSKRKLDWFLFVIAALFCFLWLVAVVLWLQRIDILWVELFPLTLLSGAFYAANIFWRRARHSIVDDK